MRFPRVTFESTTAAALTGRSPRQLTRAYAAGAMVRPRRGVYVPTDQWLAGTAADRYAITTASLAVGGASPVLCRETALMAWGVEFARMPSHVRYRTANRARTGSAAPQGLYGNEARANRVWLSRPTANGPLPQGFPDAKHLVLPTVPAQLTLPHLGIALAMEPFDVAFADTIHRLPFTEAVIMVDALLAGRDELKVQRSLEQLRALEAALPTAMARQRAALVLDFADAASESVGESLSRALMWELGFEIPELQVWITKDGRRIARVDYFWRGIELVGEFDGLQKYRRSQELSGQSAAEVVVKEKRREDEIRSTGKRVLRWVWEDLMEPERFATILYRAGVPRRV